LLRPAWIAAAACLYGTAHAAERLTLEQALALAERASPRLAASVAQTSGARAGILTARAYPNPTADFDAGHQSARDAASKSGPVGAVGISQPIDLPGVRAPRVRGAEAALEASEFALQEARLALRNAVKQAYYDVLRREAELDLAEDNRKLLEDIRRRIAVRVDVGEAPKLELTRADAEALSALNAANSARLRVREATARLRAAIGAPLPDDVDVEGDFSATPALPALPQLRDEVLARYPAIAQAQADVRRAEARVETERALRTPQPTLRAGFDQDPDFRQTRLGIALSIPLWNQRQGQIGEAVAAMQEATARAELRRVEVVAALESAYSRYQIATQQIANFEGGLLRQAEAALRVAENAYRFGERGFIEVLDAQRLLRNVRADFLNARFEQRAAFNDIEQLRAQELDGAKQ
jgi:cobalt-zinc-cadmium efflux system outer membrane protein